MRCENGKAVPNPLSPRSSEPLIIRSPEKGQGTFLLSLSHMRVLLLRRAFAGSALLRAPTSIVEQSALYCSTTTGVMSSLPADDAGWRAILSPSQFKVLRQKATEPPGFSEKTKGELEYELKINYGTKYPKEGAYLCVACNAPLYKANSKFDSGCGWPAFFEGLPNSIREVSDSDGHRVEILCNNCGSHLGHVFRGERFPTPTDERHCVNGICLKYDPASN